MVIFHCYGTVHQRVRVCILRHFSFQHDDWIFWFSQRYGALIFIAKWTGAMFTQSYVVIPELSIYSVCTLYIYICEFTQWTYVYICCIYVHDMQHTIIVVYVVDSYSLLLYMRIFAAQHAHVYPHIHRHPYWHGLHPPCISQVKSSSVMLYKSSSIRLNHIKSY